jgi:Caspase domain
MTRRALLVGNSLTYSDISKSIGPRILARTIQQLKVLLTDLEPKYAFDVATCIDERGQTVIRKLEDMARQAARDGDMLLFYYFGHGDLSSDRKLLLLHRGPSKSQHDKVGLEQLETRISEGGVAKSLFLLDCCYAGAVDQTFPYALKGDHCRIAATAPAAKAFVMSRSVEDPIGSFTSALMESFTTAEACVSNADDRVTATSLFSYLRQDDARRNASLRLHRGGMGVRQRGR